LETIVEIGLRAPQEVFGKLKKGAKNIKQKICLLNPFS
jgi:hypothetical protein